VTVTKPEKLSYSDSSHAYWVNGTRAKGVTSVAGLLDDTYNLQQWVKRNVALGMALDESLAQRAIAYHQDKGALGDVAEDALRAAKAHQAAERGSAIHRTLEAHDLGEAIIDTEANRALRRAYDKALESAGLIVVPEYVERIVLYPTQMIAGRFDRIFKRRRDGKYVIGDIKSGASAVKYPHKTAIQLALYANAPWMAAPIPSWGGKTEEFEHLPDKLDLKWAYVIYTPDEHTVEVLKIEISHAFDMVKKSIFPALEWRKRDDLITSVGSTSVDEVNAPATEERVAWIKGRLQLVTMLDEAEKAKTLCASRWPEGVGKPKDPNVVWSEADVDALDQMLQTVEKDCSMPFPIADPGHKNMNARAA
jgi:hypothetical protein